MTKPCNNKRIPKRSSQWAGINPYLLAPTCFAILLGIGVTPRLMRQAELNQVHHELTVEIPEVKATVAKAAQGSTDLLLPGDTQPIQDVPVYAKVNGYLHDRYVEIGDTVKTGQLLATIETPEIDQQVEQAKANLKVADATLASAKSDCLTYQSQLKASQASIKQAKTNLDFSSVEYKRYTRLADDGAVSYEQRDQAFRQYNSDTAALQVAEQNEKAARTQLISAENKVTAASRTVEANQANLRQNEATRAYQNVVAPCDGVITARYADAGSLVAPGGGQGSTRILTMAKTDVLRIYVDVPQSDYRYIHRGDKADVLLQEYPGRVFPGTVINISGGLNSNSRTIQTEVHVANQGNIVKPGSYAQVRFSYVRQDPPVVIPSNAIISRNDGLYVAIISQGKIRYHRIEVARDFGNKMEVKSGLKLNDVVLLDTPDGITDGENVKPLLSALAN